MFSQTRNRRLGRTLIPVLVLTLLASSQTTVAQDDELPDVPKQQKEQDARQQGINHKQMLENIAKQPLMEEPFVKENGTPLTDEERKEVARSESLLTSAAEARIQGDYKNAVKNIDEAVSILRKTLGIRNHRTASALLEQRELAKIVDFTKAKQESIQKADKALADAKQAHAEGDYVKSKDLAMEAVRAYEANIGKDTTSLVPSLITLGRAETELSHLDAAETALTKALTIAENAYGKNHPQVARVLDRQGWLLINQRKHREGIAAMTRAVRIFRLNMGETAELAETLDNLGTALAMVPDYGRALASKLRAYFIREKVLGADAKDTGVSLSNLAWLYARGNEEQRKEVIPLRKRALAIFKRVLGPDHPYTLLEMANLAASYRSEDLDDDALGLYKDLIARDEAQPEPVNKPMIERRIVVGNFLLRRGDVADGLKHLAVAADLAAKLYKQGDRENASEQLQILATAYYNQRKYNKAINAIELVQRWAKDAKEEKNDFTVGRLRRLGAILLEVGRTDEGIAILEQAAKDAKEVFGEGDLRTGTPLLKLAEGYEAAKQLDKAEQACNEALRIAEEKLPPGSRSYAYCLRVAGRIYTASKQYDLAEFSFKEAKNILEDPRVRGLDPLALVGTLQDLAQCAIKQGEIDDGIQLYRDALKICEETVSDPLTVNMIAELAKAKYHLWRALAEKADASKERQQLKEDVKTLLSKLKDAEGMSAENKTWLAEIS